jgi:hypothetical protein
MAYGLSNRLWENMRKQMRSAQPEHYVEVFHQANCQGFISGIQPSLTESSTLMIQFAEHE